MSLRNLLYRLARLMGDGESIAKGKPNRRLVSRKLHGAAGDRAKRALKGMFK